MNLKKIPTALLLTLFSTAGHAAFVGNTLPTGSTADWTDITFSGTSQVLDSSGTFSTLTTAQNAGVWFGWGNIYADTPSWTPGTNTEGNYLALQASFSISAADWSAYFYDKTHYASFIFAPTNCNASISNCYGTAGLQGVNISHAGATATDFAETFIALDLTVEHSYEFLLKDELVAYRIDGQIVYAGLAYAGALSRPLLVIGDGSGSSRSGVGSMKVHGVGFDNAPVGSVIVSAVPVPAAAWLFGSGLIALVGMARRKN